MISMDVTELPIDIYDFHEYKLIIIAVRFYLIASRSPPGQRSLRLGTHFYHFGIPFGGTFAILGTLWVHFRKKTDLGRQRCHQRRQSEIFLMCFTFWDPISEPFLTDFMFVYVIHYVLFDCAFKA